MTDVKELWPTIKTTEQKQKDHIAELEAGHKWNVHELDKRLTIIKQRDETIAKLEAENAQKKKALEEIIVCGPGGLIDRIAEAALQSDAEEAYECDPMHYERTQR
jgi:hypothetical protein